MLDLPSVSTLKSYMSSFGRTVGLPVVMIREHAIKLHLQATAEQKRRQENGSDICIGLLLTL